MSNGDIQMQSVECKMQNYKARNAQKRLDKQKKQEKPDRRAV